MRTCIAWLLPLASFMSPCAMAITPGVDAVQMQRLIQTSQEQLKTAQELLNQARHDSASLDRASGVLDRLAKGIDQEIQPLQGTSAYNQAILKLQEEQAGAAKAGASAVKGENEDQARARQNFYQVQQASHRAELEDLANHRQISDALAKAPPGFVPKLQTQTELGQWQTEVRISAQLTELLAAVHGLSKDLHGSREDKLPEGFALFLSGASEHARVIQKGGMRVP